jgi:alkanesulfonate monooxygenase SsuD/methylene tetrahydromethanopterin reductase-like flavin-dependent oxidoreductase (luciferase family)
MQRSNRTGIGVALPTSGPFATPENIFAVAERAEQCGFADVWVNDHYSYPRARLSRSSVGSVEAVSDQDPNFFESLTTLALVAGRLHRIGVAVHGLMLPLRDPRLFAKQISTIAEMSGRRLTVAPGIGGSRDEFAAAGVPFEKRGKITDEYLEVLDSITHRDHPLSFHGARIEFEDGTFYPLPTGVRLWITGDSEPALRRVVRWASGWFSSGWATLDDYRRLGARLDELAVLAGREPGSIRRASDPFCCVAAARDDALQIAGPTLEARFRSRERALAHSAVGSTADVRDQLERLREAGCDYFELRFICHDMASCLEMIERVGNDVVPAFAC